MFLFIMIYAVLALLALSVLERLPPTSPQRAGRDIRKRNFALTSALPEGAFG